MPKSKSSLSLRQALNLLTYSYDTPYSQRAQIYSHILSTFSSDLLRLSSSSIRSDTSSIFDFSELPFHSLIGDGFQYLPSLSTSYIRDILSFATKTFQDIPDSCKAQVPPNLLHSNPTLLSLFCSRHIVDPIAHYLNIIPSIQYISLWKTDPTIDSARTSEMYWHMDHHGHKFVKVFFYLSDVDLGDGHHQFISNSHIQSDFDDFVSKKSPLLFQHLTSKRRLRGKHYMSDDVLLPIMDRCISVVGSCGLGFMEDTRGLHRGTPIISDRSRVILQALFVPFDSMKDPIVKVNIPPDLIRQIQRHNSYTKVEVSKILSIIN
tara:strand:- start:3559 stop:4518 length:960 start_codon:yes stop_codon:yes gene_type:complete